MTEENLSEAMHLRMTEADKQRLDALAKRLRVLKRAAIARAALRLGMQLIEQDPAKALEAGAGDSAD